MASTTTLHKENENNSSHSFTDRIEMEDHERNALAAPPADFCDLNAICESAARIGKELAELPCDENSPAVSEGIVVRLAKADNGKCTDCGAGLRKAKNLKDVSACPKCGKLYSMSQGDSPRWFIWEKGMATFVARRIAHKWAQPAGGPPPDSGVSGRRPAVCLLTPPPSCPKCFRISQGRPACSGPSRPESSSKEPAALSLSTP